MTCWGHYGVCVGPGRSHLVGHSVGNPLHLLQSSSKAYSMCFTIIKNRQRSVRWWVIQLAKWDKYKPPGGARSQKGRYLVLETLRYSVYEMLINQWRIGEKKKLYKKKKRLDKQWRKVYNQPPPKPPTKMESISGDRAAASQQGNDIFI
jgi:hypothetical protein